MRGSGLDSSVRQYGGIDAALSIAEAQQRVEASRAIRNGLPDAEIAVVATPAPDAATKRGP